MIYAMVCLGMLFLSACSTQPKEEDVKEVVRHYYLGLSTQAGGGSYEIDQIAILHKFKTMHNDTLQFVVAVSGGYENGSIAGDAGALRDFSDTVPFEIYKNSAGYWVGNKLENFVSPIEH